MTLAAVEHKDAVQAVLGASSALAGLVLVFLGLVVNTLQSYTSGTPDVVTRGYRILASVAGAAFLCGVASMAFCVWWLAGDQQASFRRLALGTFGAQLVLLIATAAAVLIVFVWRDQ